MVAAAVLLFPFAVQAQSSSINAFSPYTMYGIGELNTPGTLPMRSMGGVGVAMRSVGQLNQWVNLLNPAAYSAAAPKSFLFNFEMEGEDYYNSQTAEGTAKRSAYNAFNFHDISFQIPLAKKLGLGFSLTPYSSVGYRIKYNQPYDPNDPAWGNIGNIQYNYQGDGDITEVKLGVGWEPFKNFSIGAAAQYYWGDINRSFTMTPTVIVGDGTVSTTVGSQDYGISRFKGQVGVQWNAIANEKRVLTVGATFDIGGNLRPEATNSITVGNLYSTVVKGDTTHLAISLPRQIAAGLFYQTPKLAVGFDYTYQNWGSGNSATEQTGLSGAGNSYTVAYANTSTFKIGIQYTPNYGDVRHFMNRWSYRAGLRYGDYQQTFDGHRISQFAVTCGVGVPFRFLGVSMIDVGFEYGIRGMNLAKSLGLVRQQYFKFAIGFTLFAGQDNDSWFLRPKYD